MGIHMKNSVNYTGGGMGVGATKLELTLDEYEALTPEEKNNGTMYFLTDVNGDGEQFQPIIYSEDEHEIGVWTDGRPIYEKTVVNTLALTSSWQQYIPASDFAVVISAEGIYRRGGEYVSSAFSQYAIAAWILRDGYIQVGINGGENDWEILALTIRYTKSTDQPGSGQWTPQGVPAVHYNNTEKIVGTWFGETLYEKSYYVQGVKDSAVTVDSLITGTTVKLIEVKQAFFTTGGAYVNVWGNNSISSNMFLRTLLGAGGLGVNFDGYRTDYYGNDGFDVYLTIRYTKISSS